MLSAFTFFLVVLHHVNLTMTCLSHLFAIWLSVSPGLIHFVRFLSLYNGWCNKALICKQTWSCQQKRNTTFLSLLLLLLIFAPTWCIWNFIFRIKLRNSFLLKKMRQKEKVREKVKVNDSMLIYCIHVPSESMSADTVLWFACAIICFCFAINNKYHTSFRCLYSSSLE